MATVCGLELFFAPAIAVRKVGREVAWRWAMVIALQVVLLAVAA